MNESRALIVRALTRLVPGSEPPAPVTAEPPGALAPPPAAAETPSPAVTQQAQTAPPAAAQVETVAPAAPPAPSPEPVGNGRIDTSGPTVDLGDLLQEDTPDPAVSPDIEVQIEAAMAPVTTPAPAPVVEAAPEAAPPEPEPEPAQPPMAVVQPETPVEESEPTAAEPSAVPSVPDDLDTGLVSLSETMDALTDVRQRDEIASVVLRYAETVFERTALFVLKRDMVAGWEGRGDGMAQKTIRTILVPLGTPSVFKTVYETKVLYYGGMPKTTVNDLFLNAIGGDRSPTRVVVLPFVLKGKVVCALYGDGRGANDMSPRMIGQLYELGRAVSGAFESLIMKAKQATG